MPQEWHQLSGQLSCRREWDSCHRAWGSWHKGWDSTLEFLVCQACLGCLTPTRCLGPSLQPRSSPRCLRLAVQTPGNGRLMTKIKERGRFSGTSFPVARLARGVIFNPPPPKKKKKSSLVLGVNGISANWSWQSRISPMPALTAPSRQRTLFTQKVACRLLDYFDTAAAMPLG